MFHLSDYLSFLYCTEYDNEYNTTNEAVQIQIAPLPIFMGQIPLIFPFPYSMMKQKNIFEKAPYPMRRIYIMKKVKQVLAIIGVILLVALYLTTLVYAITDTSGTMDLFFASIVATILIPVLLWAYTFISRLIKKK